MTRRLKVPFSLARKRIRASLNKYNVYNALTWRKNRPLGTQYRQVFFAKQEARAYHGDRLTENQFKNHFRGELPVVSPLNKQSNDSAEDIPYAMQTFVGLERRLDFAVFRSLFASSVRQAAVFILRGSVKVNGVRVKRPGYILRPGDMLSVNPRRVLFALGRPKPSKDESVKLTNKIIAKFNNYVDECHAEPEKMWRRREKTRKRHHAYAARYDSRKRQRAELHNTTVQKEMNAQISAVKPKSMLEKVLKGELVADKKVEGTLAELKKLYGTEELASTEPSATEPAATASAVETSASVAAEPEFKVGAKPLLAKLVEWEKDRIGTSHRARMIRVGEPEPFDPKWVERLPPKQDLLKADEIENIDDVKVTLPFSTTGGKLYGLSEPKKSWFTPWSPRQFVAPFAVLPHHIEVDFETCHAIYLRDPVARPGNSEIVSPFSLDVHERAYLWYIYRRRKQLPAI